MRQALLVLSLAALLAGCSAEADPNAAAAGAPAADPLAAPLARAAAADRSLLVMLTKEGCGCCARMETEVLSDHEVVEMLGKMEFARVTKDVDADGFLADHPEAEAPAFVVLGPDGRPRGDVLNGPFDAGELLHLLDWVVAPEGPQPAILRSDEPCPGDCASHEEGAATDEGCGGCGEEEKPEEPKVVDEGDCGG